MKNIHQTKPSKTNKVDSSTNRLVNTKAVFAALLLSLSVSFVGNTQAPQLFSGGWMINDQHPFTCITHGNLPSPMKFRIRNTRLVNDGAPVKFRIYDEGIAYTAILPEGGAMIVETKSLAIEQIGTGTSAFANWEVIGENDANFDQVSWIAFPEPTERVLIGAFDTETAFTLGINRSNACSNESILIYVDNVPVSDLNGNPLVFIQGASITAVGKIIEVKITGNCTGDESFNGTLKIEQ